MFSARKWMSLVVLALPLCLAGVSLGFVVDDEDVPDVTTRVARLSYLDGDVQVRHAGQQDWEKGVANLPVVEGDELTTAAGARAEIEFDSRTFVRLGGSSYLRVVTLQDSGIALSLPEGSLSARVNDFNKDKAFLEIDIPKATIAIEKSGLYRIDPGAEDSTDAHVRVTDGGQARIYSETSGFTLKNGRSATIFLGGDRAGEWETADAAPFTDDFDTWTLDRDSTIAKRLKDAYYDKYYDRDIYGAEDLSGYGDWIYTKSYGYVWRPYASTISPYADWSPYRYGHWRWVPPYGWTWVNDEPWGWATYHWGRWVWDDNYWVWSPYGYYRPSRSWWEPALVVISVLNADVCWYPLPYRYRYYNYNHNYHGGRRGDRDWDGDRRGGRDGRGGRGDNRGGSNGGGSNAGNPSASPTPGAARGPVLGYSNAERLQRDLTPPLLLIPQTGVVTMPSTAFGTGQGSGRRATPDVAKGVLAKAPDQPLTPNINLPSGEQVAERVKKDTRVEAPPITRGQLPKTGVAERVDNKPMDEALKKSRMLGNRPPVQPTATPAEANSPMVRGVDQIRNTGAVSRPAKREDTPAADTPSTGDTESKPVQKGVLPKVDTPRRDEPKIDQPQKAIPRSDSSPTRDTPVYSPPKQDAPRSEPKRDTPVYSPPPRQETPRSEPKRDTPSPPRSEPKQDRPSSPKSEPKEDKPAAPSKKG